MEPLQARRLPPHKSEKKFREYEQTIAAIVKNFPTATRHYPTKRIPPLSPVTFSCRLRDSIASFCDNGFTSEVVDKKLLLSIRDAIVVAIDQRDGTIVAGSRENVRIAIKADSFSPTPVTTEQIAQQQRDLALPIRTIVNPDMETVEAFALLRSKGFLANVPSFCFTDHTFHEMLTAIEVKYDVGFVPVDGDHTYQLV